MILARVVMHTSYAVPAVLVLLANIFCCQSFEFLRVFSVFMFLCLYAWSAVSTASACLIRPARCLLSIKSCFTMFLSKYNDDDDEDDDDGPEADFKPNPARRPLFGFNALPQNNRKQVNVKVRSRRLKPVSIGTDKLYLKI